MESFIIKVFSEGGAVLGVLIILSLFFWFILRHFIQQSNMVLEMAIKQNESWQKVIDEHTAQAREFHNRSALGDSYQREEHKSIMETLAKMTTTFIEEHNNRSRENLKVANILEKICSQVESCAKP
jgi:hypothetical protein